MSSDSARAPFPLPDLQEREEPPPVTGTGLAGDTSRLACASTLILDWDRERYAGAVPRRLPLPTEDPGPSWLAFPHQRYVLCARHARGRIDVVYVTSLVGKRDSLIPAGTVERIVTDDRSITVVVDGRPYLYAVDAGTTFDLTNRRVLGATPGSNYA